VKPLASLLYFEVSLLQALLMLIVYSSICVFSFTWIAAYCSYLQSLGLISCRKLFFCL